MSALSIRWRLTAWYSAALLIGLAAFGLAMSAALEQRLIAGVNDSLRERALGVHTMLQVEASLSTAELRQEAIEFANETIEGGLIEISDERGTYLLPAAGSSAVRFTDVPAGFSTVVRNGRRYRVFSSSLEAARQRYRVVIASDLQPVTAVLVDFRRFLLLTIPIVLTLAGMGGYWMSRKALAPVDEITRVASSISVENLSRRLPVPRTKDEIQRMSEAWNGVLERLESAVKRIQQFTADASHELRTPVALIRATAELALRRQRSVEEYRQALGQIHSETERMTELTEALLTLARSDADAASMPVGAVDLTNVIAAVVEQTQVAAAGKSITVETRASSDGLLVRANEPAIRRLLLILMDNAVKYTPAGGHVTVSTSQQNGDVRVVVEDTGDGIPADALPHIFERFYRVDPARGGSGAGLGLAIAQSIARGHNTSIAVESEPGQWTRFSVMLPAGRS